MTQLTTKSYGFVLLLLLLFASQLLAANPSQDSFWVTRDSVGKPQIHLHFFWSAQCPHCVEAVPFVRTLPQRLPWLILHDYPVSDSPENLQTYIAYAKLMKLQRIAVPGFMFCHRLITGFNNAETTGEYLIDELTKCHSEYVEKKDEEAQQVAAGNSSSVSAPLPVIGQIDPQRWSLPMLTLVLAGLDAFNPCAFFVLLFLLSLLVHTHNRRRMLIIGTVFVLFSGLIYFAFMAAWLNIFIYSGELRIVTLMAALLAISIGVINSKDFFYFKRGVSLSIPESAKPGLFHRMRELVAAGNMGSMLFSTIILALVANSYELLCTAGFPMVYTRALTIQALPTVTYYSYLAAYNLIYVTPLAVIVSIFSATLGSKKLSEFGGRVLKLISGYMMLALGVMLLFAPQGLSNVWISLQLILATLSFAAITIFLRKRWEKRLTG